MSYELENSTGGSWTDLWCIPSLPILVNWSFWWWSCWYSFKFCLPTNVGAWGCKLNQLFGSNCSIGWELDSNGLEFILLTIAIPWSQRVSIWSGHLLQLTLADFFSVFFFLGQCGVGAILLIGSSVKWPPDCLNVCWTGSRARAVFSSWTTWLPFPAVEQVGWVRWEGPELDVFMVEESQWWVGAIQLQAASQE